MQTKLLYLSKLSDNEIKDLIVEELNLGYYSGSQIIQSEDEELMVISCRNSEQSSEIGTTHYLFNDYQLLGVITKHDLQNELEFGLAISNLKNKRQRRKNYAFLRSMCKKFTSNTIVEPHHSAYASDAFRYYDSFNPIFEEFSKQNQAILDKVSTEIFNGDYSSAVSEVLKNQKKYGYASYHKYKEIADKMHDYVYKCTEEFIKASQETDPLSDY